MTRLSLDHDELLVDRIRNVTYAGASSLESLLDKRAQDFSTATHDEIREVLRYSYLLSVLRSLGEFP